MEILTKSTISIIIPFYLGNRFIGKLIDNLNELNDKSKYHIEVIIVNDSPDVEVQINDLPNFNYLILNNETNVGIHKSRINGLNVAKGEYILFLDQDDAIEANNLDTQVELIENNDVCVGNGLFEFGNGRRRIFNNRISQSLSIKKNTIIKYGTTIVSPGQCLIRRDSIPIEWKTEFLLINGADDEFLWLLMLLKKKRFVINNNIVYIHKESGNNLSYDFSKMARSSLSYEKILVSKGLLSKTEQLFFERRRYYKIERFNNKIKADLVYFDVAMYALFLKIINKL